MVWNNLLTIGPGNDFVLNKWQAITWITAELLSIGPQEPYLHSGKFISKYHLHDGSHFVQASVQVDALLQPLLAPFVIYIVMMMMVAVITASPLDNCKLLINSLVPGSYGSNFD